MWGINFLKKKAGKCAMSLIVFFRHLISWSRLTVEKSWENDLLKVLTVTTCFLLSKNRISCKLSAETWSNRIFSSVVIDNVREFTRLGRYSDVSERSARGEHFPKTIMPAGWILIIYFIFERP